MSTNETLNEIYTAAGLSDKDRSLMPDYINGIQDFYGSKAFDRLYEYFAFESCEMPYDVCKARTVCPDEWIIEYLEVRA